MAVRQGQAVWEGSLREGNGTVEFGSYSGNYTFASRFEEGDGTNPEELIGAAHAGCFSMALSADLGRADFEPKKVQTTANVHLEKVDGKQTITKVELNTEAEVPGITDEQFQEIAAGAKVGCPVSRALGSVEIVLNARLVG